MIVVVAPAAVILQYEMEDLKTFVMYVYMLMRVYVQMCYFFCSVFDNKKKDYEIKSILDSKLCVFSLTLLEYFVLRKNKVANKE